MSLQLNSPMDAIDRLLVRARHRNNLWILADIERQWVRGDRITNEQILHCWMLQEMIERERRVRPKRDKKRQLEGTA